MSSPQFSLIKTLLFATSGFLVPLFLGLMIAPRLLTSSGPTGIEPAGETNKSTQSAVQLDPVLGEDSLETEPAPTGVALDPTAVAVSTGAGSTPGGSTGGDFADGGRARSTRSKDRFSAVAVPDDVSRVFAESAFIIAINFRIEKLPATGKRTRLLLDYDASSPPYSGWGFAVSEVGGDYFPEVYWQAEGGKGGWQTFASYQFETGVDYSAYLLGKSGNYLSLFVQGPRYNNQNQVTSMQKMVANNAALSFVGGADISAIEQVELTKKLALLRPDAEDGGAKINVAQLAIGSWEEPENLSIDKALNFLSVGFEKISANISKQKLRLVFPY